MNHDICCSICIAEQYIPTSMQKVAVLVGHSPTEANGGHIMVLWLFRCVVMGLVVVLEHTMIFADYLTSLYTSYALSSCQTHLWYNHVAEKLHMIAIFCNSVFRNSLVNFYNSTGLYFVGY